MAGILLLASIGLDSPDVEDWESVWRRDGKSFTLVGITQEEDFLARSQRLTDLLNGLIGQFQRTELLSSKVLGIVGEVIEQVDTHFLGMAVWQKTMLLPDKVRHLGTLSVMEKVRKCLSELRKRIRFMKMQMQEVEKKRDLLVRYPETTRLLSECQEESLNLLFDMVGHIEEIGDELRKSLASSF